MEKWEEIFDSITKDVKTTNQRDAFLEQVEETSRWIYKGGKKTLSEKIKGAVSEEFRKLVVDLETSSQIPTGGAEAKEFLGDLEEYLNKSTLVKLTLAFFPSQDFLEKLSVWFKKQTGKGAIFDVQVKEEIIAGCLFEYAGEYRDYSLASKLDDALEKELEEAKLVKL
ncbi:MAG: F0F1 ATP synthase subunit delta [bacterium]|nr:F0F1 ATP synthase subunit delta [bacterium]